MSDNKKIQAARLNKPGPMGSHERWEGYGLTMLRLYEEEVSENAALRQKVSDAEWAHREGYEVLSPADLRCEEWAVYCPGVDHDPPTTHPTLWDAYRATREEWG